MSMEGESGRLHDGQKTVVSPSLTKSRCLLFLLWGALVEPSLVGWFYRWMRGL